MAKNNDGGPAFPFSHHREDQFYEGMSLRDWFAGQALASGTSTPSKEGTAKWCYEISRRHDGSA